MDAKKRLSEMSDYQRERTHRLAARLDGLLGRAFKAVQIDDLSQTEVMELCAMIKALPVINADESFGPYTDRLGQEYYPAMKDILAKVRQTFPMSGPDITEVGELFFGLERFNHILEGGQRRELKI